MTIKELDLDLLKKIRKYHIGVKREALSKTLAGNFSTMFKGKGMEFSGFRKYMYGDDASMIDWAASLRAKSTLVREFEVYRNFRSLIVLDVGNSMLFTSQKKLKAEYASELAYSLAAGILLSDNAVGIAMTGDNVKVQVPIEAGYGNLKMIANEMQKKENYGGHFDFRLVGKQIMSLLKEQAKVFIISDFVGLEEGWQKYLLLLAKRYDLTGIMIRDPRDSNLPEKGMQVLVEDPNSNERILIDTKQYAKKYKEYVEKEEKVISNYFLSSGSAFIKLSTAEDFEDKLVKFFKTQVASE